MDELDHNLLDAWHRVFERCKADPGEARRRYLRTLPGSTFDRPVRAWTVAIRASDTRIDHTCMVPDHGAVCAQAAHEIVLDGVALQQLGGAVDIPYPGLPIDEAAMRLGKHKEALRSWMSVRPGRTRAARAESAKGVGYDDQNMHWQEHEPTEQHPLGVRYVPQGAVGRHFGMETPVVWSDHALDPGASKGRPPARWWGTLWRSLAERIPCEFEQVVERVPRFVPYPEADGGKRPRFRGWWWKCPGLVNENEPRALASGPELQTVSSRSRLVEASESQTASSRLRLVEAPELQTASSRSRLVEAPESAGCGRLVQTLYAPLPVWTVGRYLDLQEGLDVEGLSGQWLPGVMDRWAGRRSLACERCWKLRRTSFAGYRGWNELITDLSGGLLFGREVQKPADFEYERKQAYAKRPRNRPRKRQRSEQQPSPQPAPRVVAKQAVGD
jgi:hypothetical protein